MKRNIRIANLSTVMFIVMLILGVLVLYTMDRSMGSVIELQEVSERYVQEQEAISSMREASDYLTSQSREYVVTGDRKYLDNFFEEVNTTKRRDKALDVLRTYGTNNNLYTALESALNYSNELMQIEYHAMRLAADAYGMSSAEADRYFGNLTLSDEEKKMSSE